MSSNVSRALVLAIGSMLALNACNADQGNKAGNDRIATVNGTPVKQSVLDTLIKQRAAQGAPDTPEMRKEFIEEMITREVVRQAAIKDGLDKKPEVKLQLELATDNILINSYLQEQVKAKPITDDMLKAEYDKLKGQMGDKQYHARHILVNDKKQAADIIAQLKKGASFEKLAQQKSKDASAKNGGDLGWAVPNSFVKPFADAMVALKAGEITKEPVQSPFGFHVIKLEEVKAGPTFEEVKPNLARRMQQLQAQQIVSDLKSKAKIEYAAQSAQPAPALPAAPALPGASPAPAAAPTDKK